MLEEFCRNAIYMRCREYIPNQRLVRLKGKQKEENEKFKDFFSYADSFTVYNKGMASKLINSPGSSAIRKAVGLFSRNGAFLCDHMINDSFNGNWLDAMEHYGTFNALFDGFKEYFLERKENFMKKTNELIKEQTGKLPNVSLNPRSHGGVANLLKVLTKTMTQQGSSIRAIAKVQYAICTQAGIYVPDEFITDVLVAADIAPCLSMTYDEGKEMDKNRLKTENKG